MPTPIAPDRPLLSPVELSELLGIPVGTLANWRCAGRGPRYLRLGRHVRYLSADVDAWLRKRTRSTGDR